ncbi:MAG TPA: PilZ domain-containing protein [Candidatus Sulfotelmatobacter sp.]|nr:PilZ domain-containing protein [Candidatus Sulfotelmatobacter sp.]
MTTQLRARPAPRTTRVADAQARTASVNLRVSVRYALQARVVFQWSAHDGAEKVGRGRTRDISQKGAYIETEDFPPAGTQVAMSIFLPALGGDACVLRVDAEGRVVRVDEKQETVSGIASGFAVANHEVTLSAN